MINILILGISGNVSQGILKAIKQSGIKCRIVGACVQPTTVGALWCDNVYESPYANSQDFIPWLIKICQDERIDILLTGVEENLFAISHNIKTLKSSTQTKFVVSEYDKLVIGQDKLLTCEWLKENGFNYPLYAPASKKNAVEKLVERAGYPLIAKPRNGKGSRGIMIVHNEDELHKIVANQNYVIQQCVGTIDSEFTVGCYLDKNGRSMKPIVMRRWLSNGATWRAEVVNNDLIANECQRICEAFKPMGPMNVQLRLDNDARPVPFELNVRFSGTTPMRAKFGFCDVLAAIKEYLFDEDINDCFHIHKGIAYRYVNEVYDFSSDNDNRGKHLEIDATLEDQQK